jgi:isoleucyl-tRNA synthetase
MGNTIAPQDIAKKFGAEILRLWVSAEDYREDVRISDEILNRLVEAYRRVRNTARFLISNLYDFDPAKNCVAMDQLDELDRWILQRTETLLSHCRDAYEKCEFHVVYHSVNNFCAVDLSAQYLDIVKDRLYCEGKNSTKRRAAQTTLARILDVLVHLTAPILSFTAEEIWQYLPAKDHRPTSVFLSQIPTADGGFADTALAGKWERIFAERGQVLKVLEQARTNKQIGHSLDARVVLHHSHPERSALHAIMAIDPQQLADILIVSQVAAEADQGPHDLKELSFSVQKADGTKCERCWKYNINVGADHNHRTVCPRCAGVLNAGTEA